MLPNIVPGDVPDKQFTNAFKDDCSTKASLHCCSFAKMHSSPAAVLERRASMLISIGTACASNICSHTFEFLPGSQQAKHWDCMCLKHLQSRIRISAKFAADKASIVHAGLIKHC